LKLAVIHGGGDYIAAHSLERKEFDSERGTSIYDTCGGVALSRRTGTVVGAYGLALENMGPVHREIESSLTSLVELKCLCPWMIGQLLVRGNSTADFPEPFGRSQIKQCLSLEQPIHKCLVVSCVGFPVHWDRERLVNSSAECRMNDSHKLWTIRGQRFLSFTVSRASDNYVASYKRSVSINHSGSLTIPSSEPELSYTHDHLGTVRRRAIKAQRTHNPRAGRFGSALSHVRSSLN
jgi:hypothetical protein